MPTRSEIWFVYDGECPLCRMTTRVFKIREAVGTLIFVDGRSDPTHLLLNEIKSQNLNLDEGMVIKWNDRLYHGREALHVMALIGSSSGWFNRMNVTLFKSKLLSRLFYPLFKGVRSVMLWLMGIEKIRNLRNTQ